MSIPDHWSCRGGARQLGKPFYVFSFGECSRQILFRGRAIEVGAAPMRPVLGLAGEADEKRETKRGKGIFHSFRHPCILNEERCDCNWFAPNCQKDIACATRSFVCLLIFVCIMPLPHFPQNGHPKTLQNGAGFCLHRCDKQRIPTNLPFVMVCCGDTIRARGNVSMLLALLLLAGGAIAQTGSNPV